MRDQLDLTKATPGSDLAIEHGCTCPVMDNSHGKGYMGNEGVFWINSMCPLHSELGEGGTESGGGYY